MQPYFFGSANLAKKIIIFMIILVTFMGENRKFW